MLFEYPVILVLVFRLEGRDSFEQLKSNLLSLIFTHSIH